MNIEHIVILTIMLAIWVKVLLFDNREDLPQQMLEKPALRGLRSLHGLRGT